MGRKKTSQNTYFPKKRLIKIWEEKIAKNQKSLYANIPFNNVVILVLFVNLAVISLVLLIQVFLPPEIPLFYGMPEGEKQLAPSLALTIPSVASLLILLINLAITFFTENIFLKKTLILTTVGTTLLSLITTVKIAFLVGSF